MEILVLWPMAGAFGWYLEMERRYSQQVEHGVGEFIVDVVMIIPAMIAGPLILIFGD